MSCFCDRPGVGRWLTVIVNDYVVVAAWETDTAFQLPPAALTRVPTVDDLFGIVFDAIDGGADGLETEYERQFGYPGLIEIDLCSQRHRRRTGDPVEGAAAAVSRET